MDPLPACTCSDCATLTILVVKICLLVNTAALPKMHTSLNKHCDIVHLWHIQGYSEDDVRTQFSRAAYHKRLLSMKFLP